jgi:hypothetical protein
VAFGLPVTKEGFGCSRQGGWQEQTNDNDMLNEN